MAKDIGGELWEGISMSSQTCKTCRWWTQPLRIDKRKKTEPFGTCRQIEAGGNKAYIEGSYGCSECDPYSMSTKEFRTTASFGCILWEAFKSK